MLFRRVKYYEPKNPIFVSQHFMLVNARYWFGQISRVGIGFWMAGLDWDWFEQIIF